MRAFLLNICSLGLVVIVIVACQNKKNSNEKIQQKTVQSRDITEFSSPIAKPRDVIEDLYAAINQKNYQHAYNLWENQGAASGLSFEEFARGYQNTQIAIVKFTGNAEIHGAAGSLYAKIPVRIESQLQDGTEQVFSGKYVLRKPNTEPQRSNSKWLIYDSALKQQKTK